MNNELKHDTRSKKGEKLYKNVYHHIPHCLMCHSDKFFQVKIKHFSYYKTGDFTIYDFNYKKVRKAKNANILI